MLRRIRFMLPETTGWMPYPVRSRERREVSLAMAGKRWQGKRVA